MYGINDLAFEWHELGLGVDPKVKSQLSDFEFEIIARNETICENPIAFPRKLNLVVEISKFHFLFFS